jgi:cell division protein FtsI/penicillin-binding protein 2
MIQKARTKRQTTLTVVAATLFTSNAAGVSTSPVETAARIRVASNFDVQYQNDIAQIADDGGKLHPTTLNPELQLHMQGFISERGSPISSVVLVDVLTGDILSMAQGRTPEKWGSSTHTALYNRFPAASLFKTVVTTAALEMTPTRPDQAFGLSGGCGGQDITPRGSWIDDESGSSMSLRRAFGHSCNGFFAKLAINQLGIGAITRFAKFFGWESPLPLDIALEPSKMMPPPVANSTTHTVGRFAAGFGHVGISPMHGAWMATMIANNGVAKPLNLLRDQNRNQLAMNNTPIYSSETAERLMDVMRSTVHGGTASQIFGKGRYRTIADEVGGKTGTLNGRTPAGLTSLFIGVYPVSSPRIAVASVVVLEDRYLFKAPQLAAEAILSWKEMNDKNTHARR